MVAKFGDTNTPYGFLPNAFYVQDVIHLTHVKRQHQKCNENGNNALSASQQNQTSLSYHRRDHLPQTQWADGHRVLVDRLLLNP